MRRIRILNKSKYCQGHLRRFVQQVAKEVLNDQVVPKILVTFLDTARRAYVCGSGVEKGSRIYIWMPRKQIDKRYLALVIARQLGHLKGIPYRNMKGNGRYDPLQEAYKEIYAWAEVLPLEKVEDQKTKSTLEERYFQKMIHAQQMIERTKARIRQREGQLKRAKAQLEKWEQEEIKMEKSAPVARKMVLDIGKE